MKKGSRKISKSFWRTLFNALKIIIEMLHKILSILGQIKKMHGISIIEFPSGISGIIFLLCLIK